MSTTPPPALRSSPARTSTPTRTSAGARAAATTRSSRRCRSVLPELGIPRENIVFVSGIGCSSRFPYYMNTYGFHTIHGRAPAIATGLKVDAPGALGLGGHRRRRRAVDRRQPPDPRAAPQRRPQDPAVQQPHLRPHQGPVLADLGARQEDQVDAPRLGRPPVQPDRARARRRRDASSRARVDVEAKHLQDDPAARATRTRARRSSRSSRTATSSTTARSTTLTDKDAEGRAPARARARQAARLRQEARQGHPPRRGHAARGRARSATASSESDLLVHDEHDPTLASSCSRMEPPDFPTPLGVFRAVERPTYDEAVNAQLAAAKGQGRGDLDELFTPRRHLDRRVARR